MLCWFFAMLGTTFPLKTFCMTLHSTETFTFKMRKFESLFYKINTFLLKKLPLALNCT